MDDFIDDQTFRLASTSLLSVLLDQIDEIESDDVDARLSDGFLSVTFEDSGSVFVLSLQTPTHELWLSANLTAWHFRRADGQWVERDTEQPMLQLLSGLFADKVQQPVDFSE